VDDNRFFKFVWRVNAVALFLLLAAVVIIGGVELISDAFRSNEPVVITNIADDPAGEEKWALGSPQTIEGTDFTYIPLVSEKKSIDTTSPNFKAKGLHSYGGGYFSPSRNLLFVNKKTREMSWLFKDNNQLLLDIDLLSNSAECTDDRRIIAILYRVIKSDANSDGILAADDVADLAISSSDGSNYKEILPAVERVYGTEIIEGKDLLILYQSKGKGYASTVRLNDLSVQGTSEMPRIEAP